MKGWLNTRMKPRPRCGEPYYFRLQWGILSCHFTETSAAMTRYFIHDAKVYSPDNSLEIHLQLGPLGMLYASKNSSPQAASKHSATLIANSSANFHTWFSCLRRAINRNFYKCYRLGPVLRKTSHANVYYATREGTAYKHPFAVKRISLQPASPGDDSSEATGLRLHHISKEIQLQHKGASHSPYITSVYDVFFDGYFCHIIMEYGNKSSLSHLLLAREGILPEILVRNIITQTAMGLLSLHQSNIVHRNINCDNLILRESIGSGLSVLLSDFEFATMWRPSISDSVDTFCQGLVGTEQYLAPEVARGDKYGAPADVFSLGVVCYICLTGEFPFAENENSEGSVSQETRYDMLGVLDKCERISEEAVGFCKMLLNMNWRKRPNMAGVLQHRWLRENRDDWMEQRRKMGTGNEMVNGLVVFRRIIYAVVAIEKLRRFGLRESVEQKGSVCYHSSSSESGAGADVSVRVRCFGR